MMKSEFDPDEGFWFDEMGIYVDLGFLGTHNDYQADRLFIPYKRPRRKSKNDPIIALNDQQKTYNKQVRKIRIRAEHAIGGLKRYRFLSDRLRMKRRAQYHRNFRDLCSIVKLSVN